MSLADTVKAALDQLNQAQAKILSSGGNPPPAMAEQFQQLQGQMAGDMGRVQKLSDQMEEAKAKLNAQLEKEANPSPVDLDRAVDYEAYPWQFRDEHSPEPEKLRDLVQSLTPSSGTT